MAQTDGEANQGSGRVTIHDVAATAGVSVATVSRVLNSHPDVSPATRVDVMRHARELGYTNSRLAGSRPDTQVRRKIRLIGLSVPEVRSEYVTAMVTGAVEALHARQARLVICSRNREPMTLRDQLMPGLTDGALIILPSDNAEEMAMLQDSGYPFVVVEPTTTLDTRIPTVSATNWAGTRMAAEYLIELGHTHIGMISGPSDWEITKDRLAGYQAALMAAGLPLIPNLLRAASLSIEEAYHAARDLLSLAHAPSAIVALSTPLAIGVLRAAREQGLRVPSDLSLITFDDVEAASVTTPALTAVRQPLMGEARVGADMLCRLLAGQQLDANRIELSTDLIVRESTGPPRGTSFLT